MSHISAPRVRALLAWGHDAVSIAVRCGVSYQAAARAVTALCPPPPPPPPPVPEPVSESESAPPPPPPPAPAPAPAPVRRGFRFGRPLPPTRTPAAERAEAVAAYLANGGQVTHCPPGPAAGTTGLEDQFGVAAPPRPDGGWRAQAQTRRGRP
ncbi:hypothetical protein [uncultured Rhodospira sp.]|uniref:hypothetical protein n=1 Tax=uncultured Rhodospira sp. TaxID=1936189 RepID=UPI00262019FD|nr:hypothetical protein [uncultured Rhodospira sp.]